MAPTTRSEAQRAADAASPGSQGGDQAHTSSEADSWYYELDPDADNHMNEDDDDEEEDDDLYEDADEHIAANSYLFQDDGEDEDDDGMDDDDFDPNDEEEEDQDVDDDDGEMHFEVSVTLEDDEPVSARAGSRAVTRLLRIANQGQWNPRDILLFLQHPEMDSILSRVNQPGGEEFVMREFQRILQRSNQPKDPNRFPKVPSEEGTKLMYSGVFGANSDERHPKKPLARRLLERELGVGDWAENRANKGLITQTLIPNTVADQIIHHDQAVYSGQFSDDGRFFYSCSQDFKIRMYDTTNPYNWKHYKTVEYPWGQWTLTDASLSPDNKWIAYTSHSTNVMIAPTDPRDEGDPYSLDLGDGGGARGIMTGRHYGFGSIFSVRFSGDGRELVAGTNGNSVIVYDIESRSVLHNIVGHKDDVNAVCFADKLSPHIIYSGSDDATIKVWDRRSMGDQREVGAFVGHIEGLTYIDSKGDGRYVLSNGKDQSMKLWDIRKAMTSDRFRNLRRFRERRFDYRMGRYDDRHWDPHPDDNSVVTFRGHQVLQTLIRCHFSPPSATNSRYVYSGSKDGKVHIWNMDATKAGEINVREATKGTRPRGGRTRYYFSSSGGAWATCVRDASWHPYAPFIAASSLNGFSQAHGTVSVHSYGTGADDDGDPPMPRLMTENLQAPTWDNNGVGGYRYGNQDDEDSDDDDFFD